MVSQSFEAVESHALLRVSGKISEFQDTTEAHLRGPDIGIARARLAGYRRALVKRGLPLRSRYVVEAGFRDDTGYQAMRQLLRLKPTPDGVFCFNDPVAIGAIQAIRDAGLNVPGDICVVGAGNVHYSDVLAVLLTIVDQGTLEIGKRAAELLLERIGVKRAYRPKRIIITPKLVVRQSSGRGQR